MASQSAERAAESVTDPAPTQRVTNEESEAQTTQVSEPASEESRETKDEIRQLQARDREVKAHEQAHKAAGGGHAGAIHLVMETGPDGNQYAVSGEVPIDVSPVKGDPEQTLQKMATVQRAALAPANPSGADRAVAARAAATANQARAERAKESQSDQEPNSVGVTGKAAGAA